MLDTPILSKNNIDEYILLVDSIVKTTFPNFKVDPSLSDLVTTYQIHSHSRSCRKYKNHACPYYFGKFFTKQTIIAQPLPKELSDEKKNMIVEKRNTILGRVKNILTKT